MLFNINFPQTSSQHKEKTGICGAGHVTGQVVEPPWVTSHLLQKEEYSVSFSNTVVLKGYPCEFQDVVSTQYVLISFPSIYKKQMGYNNAIFKFLSPSAKLSKEKEENGKEDKRG